MPIESICGGCGKRLRVSDQHGGKKARCPGCGTIYIVPPGRSAAAPATPTPAVERSAHAPPAGPDAQGRGSTGATSHSSEHGNAASGFDASDASASATAPQANAGAAAEPQWLFRSENGHIYGPVGRDRLHQWALEGRVSENCQLQLVGGDGRWEPSTRWIHLASSGGSASGVTIGGGADFTYTPQPTAYPRYQTHTSPFAQQRSHRGPLILVFGLLGLGCMLFGILAFALGIADLSAMRAGDMDNSGRSLTLAGTILGGCVAVLNVAVFLLVLMTG